jgi:hypothetical protein
MFAPMIVKLQDLSFGSLHRPVLFKVMSPATVGSPTTCGMYRLISDLTHYCLFVSLFVWSDHII